MNEWEIQVRGQCYRVWAPTLQAAFETFCIDMDFYEIPPKDMCGEDVEIDSMPENITPGF
jgi:hypothetical protein